MRGEFYDGNVIDWQLGAGINILPLISGGASAPDPRRGAIGLPVFGVVNRYGPNAEAAVDWSPLILRNAVLGCSNSYPNQAGSVRNRGPAALLITAAHKGSSADDAFFGYGFRWRGLHMGLEELQSRIPLHLQKDESLEITATYTPATPAGVPGTALEPHHAILTFNTSSSANPLIRYPINGSTSGFRPQGRWNTGGLHLGPVPPGRSKTATAVLRSTGDSPLCVKRLFMANPSLGIRLLSASSALVENELAVQVGCDNLTPTVASCSGATELVADTNAGELRLPVSANVLVPAAPPPPPCETPEDYFRGCSGG
ncbi:MAG: hypothetical protein ACREUA_04660 [Burkholderiales bacterium]